MQLQYLRPSSHDHEAMRSVVRASYGCYEGILSAADWATMKQNLEDPSSFEKLEQTAIPFICKDGEMVVAAVYLMPSGEATPFFAADWAHIRRLGVLPEYRGLRIAGHLMKCCMAHARQTGEQTLALHTSGYQSAWRIYERLGFVKQRDLGLIHGHEYWLYTCAL